MKFEKNVGKMERLARFGLALVLGGLYAMGMIEGTAGVIALIVAIVMLATSLLSFCPLYTLIGKSPCGTGCCGHCKSEDAPEKANEKKEE